jgi:hypothetical protein
MSRPGTQQLHTSNVSRDIDDGLEARISDPLWFLARQWQIGEFEAEDGGRPMRVVVTAQLFPVNKLERGSERTDVRPDEPLEHQVEAEGPGGTPEAWDSAMLGYRFRLWTGRHVLETEDYDGRALDWHDFKIAGQNARKGGPQRLEMIPGQLQIEGVPEPRFWQIEDREADFDSGSAAEPNILSVLLPEFFYTDIKNWYTLPAPMPAGHVREVEKVVVVDSFGIVTEVAPIGDRGQGDAFSVFALDRENAPPTDASTLLCLNTAARVGQNDLVEEVRFLRDEGANLVWAWERQFTDANGALIETALERADEQAEAPTPGLRFRLKSETARSFIPYVPRQTASIPAVDGDIALRRARTSEVYSTANPQYRGQIVAESKFVNEEEIPRAGLRIRRTNRFARGSDGEVYFWIGRDREVAERTRKPRLAFDEIVEGPEGNSPES